MEVSPGAGTVLAVGTVLQPPRVPTVGRGWCTVPQVCGRRGTSEQPPQGGRTSVRVCRQDNAGESMEVAVLSANPQVTQHTDALVLHCSKGPSPRTRVAAQHALLERSSRGDRSCG